MSQITQYDSRTFTSTGTRCEGSAQIGDVIGYSDVANPWAAQEVLAIVTDAKWGYTHYTLLDLATGETHKATLSGYGWTFGRER